MADKVARSFDLVDEKLAEADFFIEKLKDSATDFFAARCYFSAFVSAARSVTFALQGVMKSRVDGFDEWYERKQGELRRDPLARFFHDARTEVQHFGLNAANVGHLKTVNGKSVVKLYFGSSTHGVPLKNAPSCDVVTACARYLTSIVALVHECCEVFGPAIDPREYLTEENFHRLGRTIEDAEEEVIGVRGWTDVPGVPLEARWQMLRASVPDLQVGWIFEKYLGEPISESNARAEGKDDA
jgi:hypothetical protein